MVRCSFCCGTMLNCQGSPGGGRPLPHIYCNNNGADWHRNPLNYLETQARGQFTHSGSGRRRTEEALLRSQSHRNLQETQIQCNLLTPLLSHPEQSGSQEHREAPSRLSKGLIVDGQPTVSCALMHQLELHTFFFYTFTHSSG